MQLTKQIKKEIAQIAQRLPVTLYEANAGVMYKGSQLLAMGMKEINGKAIDKDLSYALPEPWLYPVNHKRQLEKALLQSGKDGVLQYIRDVKELSTPKQLPTIQPIQI